MLGLGLPAGKDGFVQRGLLALLFASLLAGSSAGVGGATSAPARVPPSDYLVANLSGHLRVLDQQGKLLRRVPRFAAPLSGHGVQGLALTPNRLSAYVSVYEGLQHPPRLYQVSLADGTRTEIAEALSPTLSPDRTRIAYLTVEMRNGVQYLAALVVRDLPWGQARTIPLPAGDALGSPPGLVLNWSPDGRSIALSDGTRVRVVHISTATTVDSEPSIPGGKGLAPVFLDRDTVIVLANCCVGRQNLVAVDLRSGSRKLFAHISSPDENVRTVKRGTLLAVTALHQLVRVTRARVRLLANGILAATS